jgi:hypothetical protein
MSVDILSVKNIYKNQEAHKMLTHDRSQIVMRV